MARSLRRNDIDNYDGTNIPGYYQRTHLNNVIDNFMVAYIGADKALGMVPRHEVAFFAQQAVQEFSYDILHADRSMELELGPAKTALLPPDYVNIIRVTKMDSNGNTITIAPTTTTKPSTAVVQDSDYNPLFDDDGNLLSADESESTKAYRVQDYDQDRRAIDYYNGFYYNDDFSYYNQKRFGLQPLTVNYQDGTYLLDSRAGIIYFDQDFKQGDIVTLFYISDGLADGDDLDNVYVPKLAEDAIYKQILYALSRIRPSAGQMAQLYKKEAAAAKRNAKIRLMNLRPEEMIQVMRQKSKWIKH